MTEQASDRPPDGGRYPPYVQRARDRRRWELCVRAAMVALDEPEHSEAVWAATRALYWSDIPTGA